MRRWNHNVILFRAFPVYYRQCAGGGSLANQEIERVLIKCCIKGLLYVLRGPSSCCH